MKKVFAMLFAALGLGCTSCSHRAVKNMDVDKFETFIQDAGVQLVDVRTAEEFAEGGIAGAANIDMKQSDFIQKAESRLQKVKPVAVYCRSGRRSALAAQMLAGEGFQLVVNLKGGFLAWKDAGKR